VNISKDTNRERFRY